MRERLGIPNSFGPKCSAMPNSHPVDGEVRLRCYAKMRPSRNILPRFRCTLLDLQMGTMPLSCVRFRTDSCLETRPRREATGASIGCEVSGDRSQPTPYHRFSLTAASSPTFPIDLPDQTHSLALLPSIYPEAIEAPGLTAFCHRPRNILSPAPLGRISSVFRQVTKKKTLTQTAKEIRK